MLVKEIEIPYKGSQEIRIYCIGDEHGGTIHHTDTELLKTIDKVKSDKNAYWIGMGDKAEFITPSDKRCDGGGVADWVHPDNIGVDQSNWYCDLMSPIKSRCIGLLEGNHEVSIKHMAHIDVQKNICEGLNVDNLSYSAFVKFKFVRPGSNSYISKTGFFTHGSGCAITAGAKLQRLQRLMDSFDVDIVAQGHVHDLVSYSKPYLTLINGHVKQKVRVGAMTGCYFRTYTQGDSSSYGEQKNYPPVMIGSPLFIVNPMTGELKVESR